MYHLHSCCGLIFFVAFCAVSVTSLGISDWGRCKITAPDLNDCLSKAIGKMIISLRDGSEELGIPPWEPYTIPKMELNSGGGKGPVNLQLTMAETKLIHLTDTSEIKVDASKLKDMQLKIKLLVPKMNVTSKYKMGGNILAIPVRGEGDTKMFMTDSEIELQMGGKGFDKGGKTYWRVDDFHFTWVPKTLKMEYTGLFNNDKKLGDATNRVLNENWKLINREFQPFVSSEFAKTAIPIANKIVQLEPFDEMFPK